MSVINSLIRKDDGSCTLFKYPANIFTEILTGENSISQLQEFIEEEKDKKTHLQFGVTCADRGFTKEIGDYDIVASKWVKLDTMDATKPAFKSFVALI